MSPPNDINQPNVADKSTANPTSAMVEKNAANPSSAVVETSTANPSSAAANLDLGKVPDAKRVQQRLIELGYLSGVSDGVWGVNSRRALAEFRTTEKLGQDDQWDPGTEKKLFSTSTARKQQTLAFTGSWSKDASSCVDPPIKITANRAKSRDATCELNSIQQESEGRWRLKALCQLASNLRTEDTENSWTSNIELTLDDRRLTWTSEKGSENYYRCSQ
jgi:peptidoglycan hydrolase-like protein with peptidoglycan-binding domain